MKIKKFFAIKNENGRFLKFRTGNNGSKHAWVKAIKAASYGTEKQMREAIEQMKNSPYYDGLELYFIGEAESGWMAKQNQEYSVMKELSIENLIGSLVNYGGDPILVETEDQAEELLESIDMLRPITGEDELEIAKSKLELEYHDEVKNIYGFMCDGCAAVVCFSEDWEMK